MLPPSEGAVAPEDPIDRRSTTPWIKTLVPVFAAVLGLAALRLLKPDILDARLISEWMRPLGMFAPVAMVIFLAVRPLTLLPGQFFTAVAGLLFGLVWGSVYSLIGSFLGVAVVYLVARKFGTQRVKRWAGDKYRALHEAARHNDFAWAFATCINPLLPTDAMVAMAAAAGARFWPTALGVFLGTVPGTFFTAQFGSALGRGRTTLTLLSVIGLGISMAIGFRVGRRVLERFQKEKDRVEDDRSRPTRFPEPVSR